MIPPKRKMPERAGIMNFGKMQNFSKNILRFSEKTLAIYGILWYHTFWLRTAGVEATICVDAGGCRCSHRGGRVFPRSMSDLRTGRKNYECEGICTALHSAARTNFHSFCDVFLRGNCGARFTGFSDAKLLNTRKRV